MDIMKLIVALIGIAMTTIILTFLICASIIESEIEKLDRKDKKE